MPNTCVTLSHVPFIHHYMHRYDLSFGQAGLPGSCAYPYIPIVRLGGKGSTSAIVTVGSAGCVPQTGRSRKLAFLREYSVGELKDDFSLVYLSAPRCFSAFSRSSDMHFRARLLGKGTPNGTILPGRCFLLTI